VTIILDTDIQRAKQPLKKYPNVITSFHKAGYEKYGKAFIESWLKYWPEQIRLTVFYEGDDADFDMVRGVSWHPIESVEFLRDYMDSLKFPLMHGIVGDKYDINFDARMGRKSFMQAHAARNLYGGKVFWIDADSETTKHVPLTFLDECLPDEALNCYLGRDGWYFTESGFIGFNAAHPLAGRFFRNYVHVFLVGSIFTQPGWHDCFAFDAVRQVMGNGPEFVNLAKHVPHGHMHPLQISAPGKYLNHYKGARKETRVLKPEDTLGS
jgi:hypothetical protein